MGSLHHVAAQRVLSVEDLQWADVIFVMEQEHLSHIQKEFADTYLENNLVCLDIPDKYDFMQPELIEIIRFKMLESLKKLL